MNKPNQIKKEDIKEETKDEIKGETKEDNSHTIKHLVIAGGGTYGFQAYGVLQEAHKQGIWNIKNIESCYATSIGGVICIMLLLQYDSSELDDYIIKRPWDKLFHYDIYSILNSIHSTGFYDCKTFKQMLIPLFKGMDISEEITLLEFYEKTKVELHLYCTNVNTFSPVNLSYKTHPNWSVLDAVYSSCCIPIFFKPFEKEGEFYMDGGVVLNYPLDDCLLHNKPEEVLGIRKSCKKVERLQSKSNLFEYVGILFANTICRIDHEPVSAIPLEIEIESPPININDIYEFSKSENCRKEWIEKGRDLVAQL